MTSSAETLTLTRERSFNSPFVARPKDTEGLAGRSVTVATVASKHVGRFVIEPVAAADACKHVDFYTTTNNYLGSKAAASHMLRLHYA